MSNPAEPTTAYNPWPFRPVQIKVTPDHVKAYFLRNRDPMERLVDAMIKAFPYTLEAILDDDREDFEDFVATWDGEV